jgi:hypothetical protein
MIRINLLPARVSKKKQAGKQQLVLFALVLVAGLVANYVVCIGLDQADLPWKPHLLLFGAIGMATCLVVAAVVSRVFPQDRKPLKGLCWAERGD